MTGPERTATASDAETGSTARQFLTCFLGEEEYALDILRVQEIRCWDRATRIPHTSSYVKGLINLRGDIVPVVDLRERFGLPSAAYGPQTVVVVVKAQNDDPDHARTIGLVVDAVSDVYDLELAAIRPPPAMGSSRAMDFIQGLVPQQDRLLIILDVDRLVDLKVLLEETARLSVPM